MTHTEVEAPNEDGGDGLIFGHHVVALVDFLGQASELSQWDFLPTDEREMTQFIEALRKTFGRIWAWRGEFEKVFNAWLCTYESVLLEPRSAPDGGTTFRKFKETTLDLMHFSDSIVAYSPLENRHGFHNLGGVCGLLVTTGSLLPAALAQQSVFRGAVEIGMAGRFPQADLYGPALAKAHYLESKVAEYPRIVVGPILLKYLYALEHNPEDSGPARANRKAASFCLSVLTQDSDGTHIVDYLGDGFATRATNRPGLKMLHDRAFEFVSSQLDHFTRQKDTKLIERYERLLGYFRSRGYGP